MKKRKLYFLLFGFLGATLLLLSGCVTPDVTNTKRSAVEEMLLAKAADIAVADLHMPEFPVGTKLYLDTSEFEGIDKGYQMGELKIYLEEKGGIIVDSREKADYVIEVWSGAIATDYHETMVGIPEFGVPIPFAGTFQTPELPLFAKQSQVGICKIALLVNDAKTNALLFAKPEELGSAYYNRWSVLGASFSSTDLKTPHSDVEVEKK